MQHAFKLGETDHFVALSRSPQGYRLHHDAGVLPVQFSSGLDGRTWLTVADQRLEVVVATRGDTVFVQINGAAYSLRYQHPLDRLAAQSAGTAADLLKAPMPGSIVAVAVAVGDAVRKGQTLLVMESMKMETSLAAPRDGVVASVAFTKGQSFERDAVLLTLTSIE